MGHRLVDQRKMASTRDHLSDSFGSLHMQILDEEMLSEDFILWQNWQHKQPMDKRNCKINGAKARPNMTQNIVQSYRGQWLNDIPVQSSQVNMLKKSENQKQLCHFLAGGFWRKF